MARRVQDAANREEAIRAELAAADAALARAVALGASYSFTGDKEAAAAAAKAAAEAQRARSGPPVPAGALVAACKSQDLRGINDLLSRGANVNERNKVSCVADVVVASCL